MIVDFELPFVFSLKERRKVLNSLKDKLTSIRYKIILLKKYLNKAK
jgi:uncharacterized protein YlxP (DUF503 family)